MTNHDDFLNSVIAQRNINEPIPETVNAEIIDKITTKALAKLLIDFSFSGGEISLGDDDNVFTADIGYSNAIFFANKNWSALNASDYFGIIATVPSSFDKDFIAQFNQNTKIGRLYNAENEDAAIYRLDLHLTGGVTKRNIFFVIKTFISTYNNIYFEVSKEGNRKNDS